MKPLAITTLLLLVGCASAPLSHDSIAPEVAPIFERAKQDAIRNYRNQWKAEPIVPFMIIEVVDKPMVRGDSLSAGWTTGNRAVIARDYVRLNIVTHEIGHILKNRNGKGQGEDHL